MPKINPIKIYSGKTVAKSLVSPAKAKIDTAVPVIKPQTCPSLDLSTEELGFFKYNGKIVNIIFPR